MRDSRAENICNCLDNNRLNVYREGMSGRLRDELKQTKPFVSLRAEAMLNLQRTADELTREFADALKPVDISPSQYNVLRILRGAGENGWTCSEIGERMVTRDPDVTRLVDRLERRDLVQRDRIAKDRRVVNVRITQKGVNMLTDLDPVLARLERELMVRLDDDRLKLLIELLEDARGVPK